MPRLAKDDVVRRLRLSQGKSVSKKPRPDPPAPQQRIPGITRTVDSISINLSDVEDRARSTTEPSSSALQAACVALRVKGLTIPEIATALGITDKHVSRALFDARQASPVNDIDILLDQRAVHQAVDNLIALLDSGDKDATFELLKGRGHLRHHQAVKTEGQAANMTLNVAFAVSTGARPIDLAGEVFGAPRLSSGDGEK